MSFKINNFPYNQQHCNILDRQGSLDYHIFKMIDSFVHCMFLEYHAPCNIRYNICFSIIILETFFISIIPIRKLVRPITSIQSVYRNEIKKIFMAKLMASCQNYKKSYNIAKNFLRSGFLYNKCYWIWFHG